MIRLFSSTDKVFTSNGDVVLNPTKAIVHKADNGDYYLDLEMGLEYVDFIVEGNIIVAPTPTGDQAFRIGNVTKKKSKISTRCYHVFYDSENYLIVDSYVVNKNCNEALNHLNNATEPVSEFTVSSDISHVDSFRCVRKSLYEAIQTVLDRWGGHLVRDNFNIQIKSSIGQDNGIIVQYKKNLKDITCSENWDNVVTKILPVGRDGIMLNGVNPSADIYITSSTQYDLPYTKTISFNQDLNEQDYPSEQAFKEALVADLRAQATSYLATNCVPQVNYTLKANLEKLTDVGDVVEVIDERLGVHLMTNVIAFDYDCIFGKYTDIQFGNFPQTIAGLANRIASTTENYINGKGYTATSWNQIQESGAKIAEIVIDGRKYNVYAPNSESGSTVSWNQTQNSGDKIADVTIDGISQEVYAPNTQTFNEASSRVNINSVDTYPIIFGKIKKFFADLKNVAFSGAYSDLSGQPTKLSDFTNDENFVSDDPTFTEASTRANIASGESFATILGKIKKFFTDLKSVAFSGAYSDLSGTPTKLSDFTDDVGYLESSDITVTQVQSTGTKIATIDVDGTSTDLYAPNGGGGGSVNDVTVNGTSVVNAQGVAEVITSDRVAKSGDTMSGNLTIDKQDGTTSAEGFSYVILGNDKATGTDKNSTGILDLFGDTGNRVRLYALSPTATRYIGLPDKGGTVALTSDVDAKVSKSGDTMSGNLEINNTSVGASDLQLGKANQSTGRLYIYNSANSYRARLQSGTLTADRNFTFPDKGGTLVTDNIISDYVPKTQPHSQMLATCYSSGNYQWFKVAVLTVTGGYINYPIIFEVSSRGRATLSHISVIFMSTSSVDPNLARISTDFDNAWYIKKTATSTWELYCNTGGVWNNAYIHRIFGGVNNGVNVELTAQGLSSAPTDVTQVTFTGNVETAVKDSDGNAINTTYLKKVGGDMTGMLGLYNENNIAVNFRTNSGYYTTISYQTAGNEACVFATKSLIQSWLFINGEDSVANHANNRWQSLTPALQIKNNCVAIGKLIANGVTPTYKLEVVGDVRVASGHINVDNSIEIYEPATGNSVYLRKPNAVTATRNITLPNKDGTVALTSDISSRRYKENIIPLSEDEAKKILDVEIVNYDYKENVVDDEERFDQKGAIAEDVAELIPNAVTYADIDGEQLPDGINYTKFIPYLIKMVQMQQKEIEELIKAKGE